jgi:dihydrolipoamide dehydrogenase
MCARVGCMPSKLLISAADVAHEIANAGSFGIRAAPPAIEGRAVMERVRRERDRFAGFAARDTEALPEAQRLRGHARFIAPATLEVDAESGGVVRVEARAVVVATGSKPHVPESLAAVRDRVLVNDDVFELEALPDSVAVIGGGIIALEIGQALHRLGVRTALFLRSDRLGPFTDPVVQSSAREAFGRELDLRLRTSFEATPTTAGVRVRWSGEDGRSGEDEFDQLLAAAGRRPHLDGLDIEKAGLEVDARGVPLCDPLTGQCGDAPVYLAGDVTGQLALLHEAADEGKIAGFNAAHHPEVRAHRRRAPLAIAFTDPGIGMVGARHVDLDPDRIAIGSVDYGDQGRARIMNKGQGIVRVYGDRADGRLLGAEMLGPRVEHTAHLLAWAIQLGTTVDRVLELPFYHPVVEEGIRTALRALGRELRLTPEPCAFELDCGPGA